MELTKYEHACFTLHKEGKTVIVDPGSFTHDVTVPNDVAVIVITHSHQDHFDTEHIDMIIAKNPTATILAPLEVTSQLTQYTTRAVQGGDSFALEGFDFDFYGDMHATIAKEIPRIANVGVLIEDRVYYPGDAFTIPDKSVDTLALPVAAPWLKISESIEFMRAVGARLTFPTHDAILSGTGISVVDSMIEPFAEAAGTTYRRIDGQTLEIE